MPSGNLGFDPFLGLRDTSLSAKAGFNTPGVLNGLSSTFEYKAKVGEQAIAKQIEDQKNFKLNNLKGLFIQAGDTPQVSAEKANSYFSRINNSVSTDELNSVYDELSQVRDKASRNNRLYYKGDTERGATADLLGGITKFGVGLAAGFEGLVGWEGPVTKLKSQANKSLYKQNPDLETFAHPILNLSEDDFFNNIQGQINQKKTEQFGNQYIQQFGDFTTLKKELQASLSSPNKRSAFNNLKNSYLDNEYTVKGSDFYRDGEDAEAFRKRGKETLNKTGGYVEERYFHYDLENDALNSLKSSLQEQLNNIWNTPIKNAKGETVRDEAKLKDIRDSIELISARQKDLDKIYAVNSFEHGLDRLVGTGREGSLLGSFGTGIKPLMGAISTKLGFSDDFENTLEKKAMYLPKQVGIDAKGNAVMSNQAFYTKSDGSLGFNGGAVFELGLQQVGQMLPTIAVSEFTGGLLGKLASVEGNLVGTTARGISKGYEKLNKLGVAGTELKIADRLATTASVYATTYPLIEDEEKKYGGDYKSRARWKTFIEGGTEGLGFPDVGALKIRPMQSSLLGDAARISGKSVTELGFSNRLAMMWNTTKQFGKLTLKQNVSEALEEEMSLIGNALYESYNEEGFKGREKTRVNGEELLSTFAESFVGGLLYSGGTTAVGARSWAKNNNLRSLADWNAANNPELMKAKIKDLYSANKITEEEASAGLARVDLMANTLKSAFGITELKDRKARLEDKDEQYKYFTNLVNKQDLMAVDFDSLSDEDKQMFKKDQILKGVTARTARQIEKVKDRLATLKTEEDSISEDKREAYEAEVEKLNDELFKLKNTRATAVNKRDLSKKQIDFLKSKELYPETSEEFNKEDFDKMMSEIDTSLLKTKQRIDKYVNLSDAEKEAVLTESYDEQIAAIQKVSSPAMLNDNLTQLELILDDYEKTGRDFEELDKKNAERLKDAYAQRFDELTNQRNEQGFNAVEQSLNDFNFSEVSDSNNLFAIQDSLGFVESNKDFISEDLYNEHNEKLLEQYVKIIENLQGLDSQQKVDWLANYLDKAVNYNPLIAYDLNSVNDLLAKAASENFPEFKVTFNQEELDAAREKMFDLRGKKRAEKRVNAEPENLTEEQIQDSQEFQQEGEAITNQSDEVDESGKSPVNDTISENYAKHKEISIKNAGENWRDFFFERMNNLIFPYFPKLSTTTSFLKQASLDLKNGIISLDQFNNAVNNALNSIKTAAASKSPGSKEFERLKEQKDVLEAYKTYINKYYNEDLPEGFQMVTPTETTSTASTPAEETSPLRDAFPKTEVGNKMYEEAVAKADNRVARLLQLTSPLSSMAIEVGRDNQLRDDKVTQREVRALEQLASEPNVKIRLQTRAQFVKQFLAQKFPEYTITQFNEAFNTLVETFNSLNSTWTTLDEDQKMEALAPVFDILGPEFFDRDVLSWLATNKDGLLDRRPILTPVVGQELFMFEGYPPSYVLRPSTLVDENLTKELQTYGVENSEINGYNKSQKSAKDSLIKTIAADPTKYYDFNFEVTAGILIGENNVPTLLANVPEFQNVSKEDLAISTDVKSPIFGKSFIFHPGRVYLSVGGNPTLLDNIKIDSNEAIALTEMIFADDASMSSFSLYPKFNDSAQLLVQYLMNRVNQSGKKSLFFLVNPKNGQPGEPPVFVKKKTKDGWKTLTREETVEELSNAYYKADKNLLERNAVVPKFYMTDDGEVSYVEQDYVAFLMDTHTVPTLNEKPQVLRNKRLLLDTTEIAKTTNAPVAKIQPQAPVAPQPTVPKETPTVDSVEKPVPQVSTSELPKHPSTPLFNDDQYLVLGNVNMTEIYFGPKPGVIFNYATFIPSRTESIDLLKKFGVSPENITKLENISDREFQDYIFNLLNNSVEKFLLIDGNRSPIDFGIKTTKSQKGQVLKVVFKDGTSLVLATTDANSGKYSIEYSNGSKVRDEGVEYISSPIIQLGSNGSLTTSEPLTPEYDENAKFVTYFEDPEAVETPKEEPIVETSQEVSVNPAAAYVEPNDVKDAKESEETCALPTRRTAEVSGGPAKKKVSSRLSALNSRTIAPK